MVRTFRWAAALAGILWLGVSLAQDWTPSRPLRFIVPQAAGGGADSIGRLIANGLSERLGQPVIVDNRPGANGGVGAEVLIRAPADGHTLLLVFTSMMAINPAVYAKTPYDPIADFRPLGTVCDLPLVMMASNSVPASTATELVTLAKQKPELVFAASSGNGAFSHLLVEMFNARSGIKLTHVPFKGEAAAVQHLIANQSPAIYFGTPVPAIPAVQSGRVKGLAVTTARRLEQLKDLPTLQEQGLGDYNEGFWYGVVAAAATPTNIADTFDRHLGAISRSPTVGATVSKLGCAPFSLSGAEFSARIKSDLAKYAAIVKAVGMKVD